MLLPARPFAPQPAVALRPGVILPRPAVTAAGAPSRGRRRAVASDVLILALAPGGRERTTGEMAQPATRAGLALRRTVRLASGDQALVLHRSGGAQRSHSG